MITVTKVIDSEAKTGVKNGKTWSTSKVELSNGETTYIFNPIDVSDKVESYENKGYTNWRKVKEQTSGNADYDKAFKWLFEQNKKQLESLDTIMAMLTDLSAKIADSAPETPTEDKVHPVSDGEEVNLDDVPF